MTNNAKDKHDQSLLDLMMQRAGLNPNAFNVLGSEMKDGVLVVNIVERPKIGAVTCTVSIR